MGNFTSTTSVYWKVVFNDAELSTLQIRSRTDKWKITRGKDKWK